MKKRLYCATCKKKQPMKRELDKDWREEGLLFKFFTCSKCKNSIAVVVQE